MAERVKIAEIDIGVDKLVSKAAETKKRIAELQQSQKDLKKETDNLTNASQEQLEQFTKNDIEQKKLSKEYRNSTKVLDAYINIQNQDIRTKQQARDANSKLIAIANQLDATNEDQAATLKKVNAEIDKNTEFIKENASEYEKTKINIGNYKEAITGALNELGIFGDVQKKVNQISDAGGPIINFVSTNLKQVRKDYKKAAAETYGMSKAQVAAHLTTTTLTAGLRILKIALAATGIGAVVLVLGSLITYLATTQEGLDKVNMVLTPLKEAFNAVKGSVQELGAAFAKLFSGDIKGFLGDIKEIGGEMKNNIKEAVERGKEMERIQQNLNKTEADYITLQAKLKREFEEQKKLSDDTTKSLEVREKAAERSIESQKELSKLNAERIKQEAEILRMKQMSNDTSDAEKAELATKLAEIDKALQEEATKTTEAQNKLNAIRKEGAAKEKAERDAANAAAKAAQDKRIAEAKAATEAAISESKTRLQIFIEENKGKADSLKESIQLEEDVRDKKLAILQDELEAKKVTQSEYELAVLQTKNNFLDRQAALTEEYAQKELEAEKERLAKSQELEEQEKQRQLTNLENKREIEAENFEIAMELEKERLEMMRQQELDEAEKTGAEKALIIEKYAKLEEEINYQKESTKREQSAETFGDVAKLLGEQTAAGKAAAVAQATINTYQGVTEVWRSPTILPEPFGTIQKVVSTGTVLASGLSAVKKITSTNANVPKAEKGIVMDIGGKRHSQGGETFYDGAGNPIVEAEAGEKMVILKREASKELAVLSALNQKHGGVSLSKPVTYANNGGAVIRNPQVSGRNNFNLNYDKMGQAVGSYVSQNINSVQTVVPVESINDVNGKIAKPVNGSDL